MCGIICLNETRENPDGTLTHRGPDSFDTVSVGNTQLLFYRLAINDISTSGMQPFVSHDKTKAMVCNGEIFNHQELMTGFETTGSDCEPLFHMLCNRTSDDIKDIVGRLRGEFAFAFVDGTKLFVGRDPLGVRPLFCSVTGDGGYGFASEAKVLKGEAVHVFPPGCVYGPQREFELYYDVGNCVPFHDDVSLIREAFEEAVRIRVNNSDQPVGFLLSGGLDSSLVAGLANRMMEGPIRTFSVGMEGSQDLKYAREVANFLGADHTEVLFTPHELWDVLPDAVWSMETWDTTTIRAGLPMWFLARWISHNTDIKVVVSGEGSDELFGGYLYFHNAPNTQEFQEETLRRLKYIHQFDGLRADRCISAHGLEVRCPFLDDRFVSLVTSLNPIHKMCSGSIIEKHVLREAFADGKHPVIPDDVLWRQKEAFSDGVGNGWVDFLRQSGEDVYDRLFDMYFPGKRHLIHERWMPKWVPNAQDPSARVEKLTLRP
jgi:asparagine synthase (glutamine-hydrolysing)